MKCKTLGKQPGAVNVNVESDSSSCKRSWARRRRREAVTKKVLEKAGGILPGTAYSLVQPISIDTCVFVGGCVCARGRACKRHELNSPP